jgi:hypothetical protein
MNCSPTLTAEEFSKLHNGLWELDCMVEKLVHGNVHEGQKLAEIAKTLRDSLASAYEQDNKAFESKFDHYARIQDELGLTTVWSVYEVDNLSDRHPFEGADRVVYKDHWGEKAVQCSINGLTWAALYVAANACIRDSGDGHHVFIEQFTPSKDDPRTLILQTGS